jgi:hypothetical protein
LTGLDISLLGSYGKGSDGGSYKVAGLSLSGVAINADNITGVALAPFSKIYEMNGAAFSLVSFINSEKVLF